MSDINHPTKRQKSDDASVLFTVDGDSQPDAPSTNNLVPSGPVLPIPGTDQRKEEINSGVKGALSSIPCKYFLMGTCRSGPQCPFLHTLPIGIPKHGSAIVCQYFERGICRDGNHCRFLHPQHTDSSPSSGTPCRFYGTIRGCKLGKECPFVHIPAGKVEIPKTSGTSTSSHDLLGKYSAVKIAESRGVETHSRRVDN